MCVLDGCECGFSVTNTLGFMFLACSNAPQCRGDLLCFAHFVRSFQLTMVCMHMQGCLKALSHHNRGGTSRRRRIHTLPVSKTDRMQQGITKYRHFCV